MHTWNSGAGAVKIMVASSRPNIFEAEMIFTDSNAAEHNIQGTKHNGVFTFSLTANQVVDIRNNIASHVQINTAHIRIPGAPQHSWGWRYKVFRDGQQFTARDNAGPLHLGHDGFYDTPLQPFNIHVEPDSEVVKLS